jgi:hypothetical protein
MKEGVDLGHHDAAFVYAVMGYFTANRLGATCVDAKLKAENGATDAFSIKTVPVILDDGNQFGTEIGCKVSGDGDNFIEFCLVNGWVPEPEIVSGRDVFAESWVK